MSEPKDPRAINNSMNNATGSDPSGYLRSEWRDGQLVRTEGGKVAIGSVAAVTDEQNVAMGMPFDYALHPTYRTRISPHELEEDSIVSFGGAEMTIAQARGAGFIPPDWMRPGANRDQVQTQQQSRYDNGQSQGQPQTTQEPPKQDENPDLKTEALPDQGAEQAYSSLIDRTGGFEQMEAIQQVVETGAIDERTLATLATQLAIEPGQLQAQISPIMAAFEQQARAVLSQGGVASDDVVAWAQQHNPDMLRRAMHKQATMRNTSGYAELRQSFLENLAHHNPSAALNADLGPGISQRQDHLGRVIVRLPDGSEIEWDQAIRAFGPGSKR